MKDQEQNHQGTDTTGATGVQHEGNPSSKQPPANPKPKVTKAELIAGIVLIVMQLLSIKGSVQRAHALGLSYQVFPSGSLNSVAIAAFIGQHIFAIIGIILIVHWIIRKSKE